MRISFNQNGERTKIMSTRKIEKLFNTVSRQLFRIDGTLSYDRTVEAVTKLADEIMETETDEHIWYLGEGSEACLADVIAGSYWFFTDCHVGQWSAEYAALSSLGRIYSPDMITLESEDENAKAVYSAWERLFK